MIQGHVLAKDDQCVLRPCPFDGLAPYEMHGLLGGVLKKDIKSGDCIRLEDVDANRS